MRTIHDLYDPSRPETVLFELAIHCGAEFDGGEVGDQYGQATPAVMIFEGEALVKFAEKLLDGSYMYKGFQK